MTTVAWKNYVENTLGESVPLNIRLHYENMDDITISALTVVNRKIVNSLIGQGTNAIAIGVCDYSRESLAYTLEWPSTMHSEDETKSNTTHRIGNQVTLHLFVDSTLNLLVFPRTVLLDQPSPTLTKRGIPERREV